jgi:hypothetical protein
MKTNLKTLGIILIIAIFLIVAIMPIYAQEKKPQFRVKPGEKQTNPEFIKRIADPELNQEFSWRIPDPTARLKEAQALADAFCQNFTTSVSVVSTAQGCFIDVTYSHIYTYVPNTTNACILPHGLYVKVGPQAQIQSATVISGAWLSGVTPVLSGNSVYWVKICPGNNNYSNIIPSGQTLTVRIKLASGFCPGSSTVTVRELTGWAFPDNTQLWSCQQLHTITTPVVNYSIGPDTSVCTGSAFTISVVPPPPPGSTVKWYKYTPTPPTQPCPPVSCPIGPPWVLAQTGGSSFNTNILTQTTCYVAVVEYGCNVWVSNVRRVNVCPGPPDATITVTGPPTTLINNVPHACRSWSGQLCLNSSTFPCPTKIVRWEIRRRNLTYPSACNPQWGAWSPWIPISGSAGKVCINTGNLTVAPGACQTQYEFRAVLQNACGTSTPSYTIVIDRPPVPGSITAYPLPPLCYDKATKLTYSTSCAEVVEWEKREELSPCTNTWGPWTPIPGSQGTCVWWTNNLQKTTQYRVKVKNGACPPVYSPVYTVTVKPQLSVTITANQTVLCPPGVTLTAQTTYGPPCSYPVSYQWYQDGLPIPGATSSTYSPTSPGNYYVVVSDTSCGKAKSNVITVCGKPQLEIDAPCCVCPGETITVTANVLWLPANCQPPSCTYQWNTGATTPSISVTSPGTYTVTVTCGICPPMKQSVTIELCR